MRGSFVIDFCSHTKLVKTHTEYGTYGHADYSLSCVIVVNYILSSSRKYSSSYSCCII